MNSMAIKTERIVLLFALCLLTAFGGQNAWSQSGSDVRINEYLILNDSNFVDDYGQHTPWFELYNSAYNTVNVGGMYLTDDLSNPKKYYIPKGDKLTIIPQRGHLVFFAENHPTKGTLHVNFDLKNSKYIALFASNGTTLIDSVTLKSGMAKDVTVGREVDGDGKWITLEKSTPQSNNQIISQSGTAELFAKVDPYGGGIAMVSMSVVFASLLILTILFTVIGKALSGGFKRKKKITDVQDVKIVYEEISGDVSAAIGFAVCQYIKEIQAQENAIVTIRKVARTYSPWSSKIYQIRKSPR